MTDEPEIEVPLADVRDEPDVDADLEPPLEPVPVDGGELEDGVTAALFDVDVEHTDPEAEVRP